MSDSEVLVIARVPNAKTGLFSKYGPANARLIAAAPDLLVALKHTIEALAINEADIKPGLAIYLNDICRAAISIAESETPNEFKGLQEDE